MTTQIKAELKLPPSNLISCLRCMYVASLLMAVVCFFPVMISLSMMS